MTEPFYNSSYGLGAEGILNYASVLTDGWLSIAFLSALWVIMVYVMSKSEWKMPGIIAFASFITLFMSWIMKLFMVVSEQFIFVIALLLAGSLAWSILSENNK
jgi:hypothetical protein